MQFQNGGPYFLGQQAKNQHQTSEGFRMKLNYFNVIYIVLINRFCHPQLMIIIKYIFTFVNELQFTSD